MSMDSRTEQGLRRGAGTPMARQARTERPAPECSRLQMLRGTTRPGRDRPCGRLPVSGAKAPDAERRSESVAPASHPGAASTVERAQTQARPASAARQTPATPGPGHRPAPPSARAARRWPCHRSPGSSRRPARRHGRARPRLRQRDGAQRRHARGALRPARPNSRKPEPGTHSPPPRRRRTATGAAHGLPSGEVVGDQRAWRGSKAIPAVEVSVPFGFVRLICIKLRNRRSRRRRRSASAPNPGAIRA